MVTLITISLTTSTAGLVDTVTPAVLNVHRLLVLYPGVYPTVVLVTQHILFQALTRELSKQCLEYGTESDELEGVKVHLLTIRQPRGERGE